MNNPILNRTHLQSAQLWLALANKTQGSMAAVAAISFMGILSGWPEGIAQVSACVLPFGIVIVAMALANGARIRLASVPAAPESAAAIDGVRRASSAFAFAVMASLASGGAAAAIVCFNGSEAIAAVAAALWMVSTAGTLFCMSKFFRSLHDAFHAHG
ncbi:MAG: hypothetical protein JNL80_10145 [Phycisphaerae bacterium]|jgi:hypothetical protein|nr:hypothetical protein [Phycisphaerae bacterium]